MAATRKLNPSVKIAILAALVTGGAYFGYQTYAQVTVDRLKFAPIPADDVAIVAVESGYGFRVLVANQMAQLAEVGSSRGKNDEYEEESDVSTGNLKRLPIRELLKAHAGDSAALGTLISKMNDLDKDERLPTTHVVWTPENLSKALDGDAGLRTKLERDLNIQLDGTPLAGLSVNSIENGIVIPVPVHVKYKLDGTVRSMETPVLQWFLPTFSQTVMKRYEQEADVTVQRITAYYIEEAQKVNSAERGKQDIASSLRAMMKPNENSDWSTRTGSLLSATHILANSSMIRGVRTEVVTADSGKQWLNIHLDVSDEGRRRLWQFSRKKNKFQLMLVVNGIAIAAPTVREELAGSTVTISNVPNEDFIRDAVSTIEKIAQSK